MDIDIKERAKYWNKKVFDGKIDVDSVPMKYAPGSNAYGWVRARVTKRRRSTKPLNVEKILGLFICSKHDFTNDQFDATLLHELCHLYMLQNFTEFSWAGGYHGVEWQHLARTVGKKAGLDVVDSDNANIPMIKDDLVKPKYTIFALLNRGYWVYSVLSKPLANRMMEGDNLKYIKSNIDAKKIYLTLFKHKFLYTLSASNKTVKWYRPKDESRMKEMLKQILDTDNANVQHLKSV